MTLNIKNIWDSLNKTLTLINVLLFGLIYMNPFDYKKAKEKKIPIVFNILLLLILSFIAFVMTYGAYKRVNG